MKTIFRLAFALTILPANAAQMTDGFTARPRISGHTETLTADTTTATLEAGEPQGMHGGYQNRSVWAEWVAPDNGWVTIDTSGSFPKAILAIYTGSSMTGLETVSRAPYISLTTPSSTRFPVSRGNIYQIALDGESTAPSQSRGAGRVNLRLDTSLQIPGVPGHDRFSLRGGLQGAEAWGVANNERASLDPFQPEHTGSSRRDVWWEWTAPATGTVTIDTLASTTDTVIVAYSGNPVNEYPWEELDMVGRNDDVPNSRASSVVFRTEAGRTYQIAIGGGSTSLLSRGNILLHLRLVADGGPVGIPGTDRFVHRPDLEGTNARGVGCNAFATADAFETVPSGDYGRSVWWSWTSPADGFYDIDTRGSEVIYPSLRIYRGEVIGSLVQVASNKGVTGATWSSIRLFAPRGTIYQIRVDSTRISSRGNLTLNLAKLAAPEIEVFHSTTVGLKDGQGALALGKVRRGSRSAVRTITIRNTGTAPLAGIRLATSGAVRDFVVGRLPKAVLAPGESMNFPITFKPKSIGAKSLSVSIVSNDADENPFDIRVTGKATKR